MNDEIRFPETTLRVTCLSDPLFEQLGHDPRSEYVETYWLPILGPLAWCLIRRLASEMDASPEGFEVDTTQWAVELGVGMRGGKHGPFWRGLERCGRFGALKRNGNLVAVRTHLAPITARQLQKLPKSLQSSHVSDIAGMNNTTPQHHDPTSSTSKDHAPTGATASRLTVDDDGYVIDNELGGYVGYVQTGDGTTWTGIHVGIEDPTTTTTVGRYPSRDEAAQAVHHWIYSNVEPDEWENHVTPLHAD